MQPNHKFIRRNWRTIFTGIAFSIDSIAIFSCGHSSWYLLSKFSIGPVLPLMNAVEESVYFGGIFIFFALIIGLYRQSFFTNSNFQYLLAAKAYVYASVVILASFYMLNLIHIPRSFTVLYLFLLPVHFILGRLLLTGINYLFKMFRFIMISHEFCIPTFIKVGLPTGSFTHIKPACKCCQSIYVL